jgi:hypothetical protein
VPEIDDWMAKVLKDLDSEKDTSDPGSAVMPCPKRAAAIVVMVWCPDDGKLLGLAEVALSGASQKKDKTAPVIGVVAIHPVPAGDYQASVTLAKSDAKIYDPPAAQSFTVSPEEIKLVLVPVTRLLPQVASVLKTLPGTAEAQLAPAPRPGAAAVVASDPARAAAVVESSE